MPNFRVFIAVLAAAIVVGGGVIALLVFRNDETSGLGTTSAVVLDLPVDATVSSVEIIGYEKREGMRRVRVGLTVERQDGTAQQIVVTEWVPVVLLGRLRVGSRVQLIKDPVDGRLTFAL